jgi:hypothetical protein
MQKDVRYNGGLSSPVFLSNCQASVSSASIIAPRQADNFA